MSFSNLHRLNKVSQVFQPKNLIPKHATKKHKGISKSQQLMLDLGIIRQGSLGCFHLLPLGLRSLEKLLKIVDREMYKLGAQKVTLPSFTHSDLWKASGRIEIAKDELFIVEDRHQKKYILSPTHEESITDLISSVSPLSYKQLPLRLYQATSKYRDEIKPRFGLMRSRQFVMKDLYTFDVSVDQARETYDEVCNSYNNIFNLIGLNYIKVLGATGNIGGTLSHEYHFPAAVGEDRLLFCKACNYIANVELCGTEKCVKCNNVDFTITSGIEVGHTFLLGQKYSSPLNANYLGRDGKSHILQMGSYGLGISRILAASVEVLSLEHEIRWPLSIAPYTVLIIPPKRGSKEESSSKFANKIYLTLESIIPHLSNDIIIDDRVDMTIGKRLLEGRMIGYPYIIVIGNTSIEDTPLFELHDINNNSDFKLPENEIYNFILERIVKLN